jgi:hypothetical protein
MGGNAKYLMLLGPFGGQVGDGLSQIRRYVLVRRPRDKQRPSSFRETNF